jgi:predicted Zn-dependent protease
VLSAYDENCTKLLRLTVSAAEALKANGMDTEAIAFLEFGVDCQTDITSNYTMLAEYYSARGESEKISGLIEKAEKLGTLNKEVIIKKLNDAIHMF